VSDVSIKPAKRVQASDQWKNNRKWGASQQPKAQGLESNQRKTENRYPDDRNDRECHR
jgi:hypothetical protein